MPFSILVLWFIVCVVACQQLVGIVAWSVCLVVLLLLKEVCIHIMLRLGLINTKNVTLCEVRR
jgi:hypothetical protein